jgi:hypothetical protein
MVNVCILFVAFSAAFGAVNVAASITKIIKNEHELIGTCTGTCNSIPVVYGKPKGVCNKISNCALSSVGWNRNLVRCDYCVCDCEREAAKKDILVSTKYMQDNEENLFSTCTGTCYHSGLVRTNYKGCNEVRDCKMAYGGWLKGFVMCNYCTCSCLAKTTAEKYSLKNVKYDMSQANLKALGRPIALATTTLEVRRLCIFMNNLLL